MKLQKMTPQPTNTRGIKFKIFDIQSKDLPDLFLMLEGVLESLSSEDYKELCILRYGDKNQILINEFIERVKSSDLFVGMYLNNNMVGLGELYPPNNNGLSEMCYLIFRQYQGRGLGYLLAEKLLEVGLKKRKKGVYAECVDTNLTSLKLLEKLNLNYPAGEVFKNTNYNPPTKVYFWKC